VSAGVAADLAPAVSVVLATSSAPTVRRTLGDYRAQTIACRLEVVLVAPPAELARVAPEGAPELSRLVRVAAAEPFDLPAARARGFLAASARWVFVGETHSFPQPAMMESLLSAAERSTAAERAHCLMPLIDNANPSCAASWASLLIDYGAWGPGRGESDAVRPPIYNALFDRETVARRGADLARALSPHDDSLFPLPAGPGVRARFVPAAAILHLNVERFADFAVSKYFSGLANGASRAARWGWPRRLAYAAAAPLIAALLFRRYLAATRAVRSVRRLPAGVVPWLVLGAVVRAAGEAQGYLGAAPAWVEARVQHFEIHKADFVKGWVQ
jgi:hypothetical protein